MVIFLDTENISFFKHYFKLIKYSYTRKVFACNKVQ